MAATMTRPGMKDAIARKKPLIPDSR